MLSLLDLHVKQRFSSSSVTELFIKRKQRLYSKAQTKIAPWSCEISGQVIPTRCYPCELKMYMIHWITTKKNYKKIKDRAAKDTARYHDVVHKDTTIKKH